MPGESREVEPGMGLEVIGRSSRTEPVRILKAGRVFNRRPPTSDDEIVSLIKEKYKVDYLLLNRNYQETLISLYNMGYLGYDPKGNILFSEEMKVYLKTVFSSGNYSLYKLIL